MTVPSAIIVDGKIKNHEQLERYWRNRNFQLDRIQRGIFNDLRIKKEEDTQREQVSPQEIIHRHIHYRSDVSKKQWSRIDAISNELTYLREAVTELQARRKPRGRY